MTWSGGQGGAADLAATSTGHLGEQYACHRAWWEAEAGTGYGARTHCVEEPYPEPGRVPLGFVISGPTQDLFSGTQNRFSCSASSCANATSS